MLAAMNLGNPTRGPVIAYHDFMRQVMTFKRFKASPGVIPSLRVLDIVWCTGGISPLAVDFNR
jgi:hypothetical protein